MVMGCLCTIYVCVLTEFFGVQSRSRGCQVFLSSCYCCAFMADEVQSCLHAERNVSCPRLEVFERGWAVPWGLFLDSLGAGEAFLHCLSLLVFTL